MQPDGSQPQPVIKTVSISPDPHPEQKVIDRPPKPPTPQKTKTLIALTVVLTLTILAIFVVIVLSMFNRFPKSCTQEARLCPDGKTTVDRSGPNCQFAACPPPVTSQ